LPSNHARPSPVINKRWLIVLKCCKIYGGRKDRTKTSQFLHHNLEYVSVVDLRLSREMLDALI
jgi:hypothetical protein